MTTLMTKHILPTLTVKGNYNRAGLSETAGDGLITALAKLPTLTARDARTPGSAREMRRDGTPGLATALGGLLGPNFAEWFMGFPLNWTTCDEEMFAMRIGYGPKALSKWRARRLGPISDPEILQPPLYGAGNDEAGSWTTGMEPASAGSPENLLRALRNCREYPNPSPGSKLAKHGALQLDDALRTMSHVLASRTRPSGAEGAEAALYRLRQTFLSTLALQHASHSVETAWGSIAEANKDWLVVASCFGAWWAEIHGVPRVIYRPSTKLDRRIRAERVKALGNSMVPAQAREAFCRLSGLGGGD